MTPKIADIIRDMLKIPPFKYGGAFGEATSPITGPAGTYLSGVGKRLSEQPLPPGTGDLQTLIIRAGGGIASTAGGSLSEISRGKT